LKFVVALSIGFVGSLPAQQAQSRTPFDAFEVATIRPTPVDAARGRYIRMESAHQLIAKNHTLKTLIEAAYNLSPQTISGGPAWVDEDHYDILAKAPGEVRPNLDEQMAMLRTLLSDRFSLAFHRERKEFPIYILTIAKGGVRMRESTVSADATPEGPPALVFVIAPPLARMPGRDATVGELASVLQRAALDRPVVDKTELTGRYDFDLEFMPDETQFGGMVGSGSPDSGKPDLFAAIQRQLGLKLEATKGPVDALVIDKAERPSEN